MTDNINKLSEGQENHNKELGIKLYPKEYFDMNFRQ